MDGGHVPRHISASSFKPDGVLAFITLSSLSIFFCWPAERILFFNLDSIIGVAVVLHLVDSGPVSPQILKTSHTIIALVTHNSSPVFILFGFSDGIFHFKDVNLKQYETFGVFQAA